VTFCPQNPQAACYRRSSAAWPRPAGQCATVAGLAGGDSFTLTGTLSRFGQRWVSASTARFG
jgi:hypothetical protein